jgi:hypothetical protein
VVSLTQQSYSDPENLAQDNIMAQSMPTLITATRGFIAREKALLVPLALATFGLGQAVSILVFGMARAGGWSNILIALMIAAILWTQVGYLAVSALALKPGRSVGEALSHGFSRLPALVAIVIVMGVLISAITIPFSIAAQMNGIDLTQPSAAASMVVAVPIAVIMLIMFAKLYLVYAVLVDRDEGAAKTAMHAYSLSRGRTFFLLCIALFFILVFQIVQFLGALIGSAIFVSIFAALGSPFAGSVMVALISGIAAAFPMVVSSVFSSLLYQRLNEQRDMGS